MIIKNLKKFNLYSHKKLKFNKVNFNRNRCNNNSNYNNNIFINNNFNKMYKKDKNSTILHLLRNLVVIGQKSWIWC